MVLTACGDGNDKPVAEYGCPHADYVISGSVVNSKLTPINGIEVEFDEFTTYSDANGQWMLNVSAFPCYTDCKLTFTDVDDDQNGSVFRTETIDLELVQTKQESSWYEGRFEQQDILTQLEKEEE